MEKESVYDRIKIIADLFYGNETKMMKEIGFKQSTYVMGKNRGSDVSLDLIRKILSLKLNINPTWLINGEGDMYFNGTDYNNVNSVVTVLNEDLSIYESNTPEILTNKYGNRFFLYSDGTTVIEVVKIPLKAHASYVESYFDERINDDFEKVKFDVDHVGSGHYQCFETDGDSMDSEKTGLGIDIPDGSVLLAREIKRELWYNLHRTDLGQIYITKKGIWHKDFKSYDMGTGEITLSSRNKKHKDFKVSINDIYQIFNVIKIKKQ